MADEDRAVGDGRAAVARAAAPYHLLLGAAERHSAQWAIIGRAPGLAGKLVALEVNQPLTVLLVGVQGSGKTTALQLIAEASCMAIPQLSAVPSPRCVIAVHHGLSGHDDPEFIGMGVALQDRVLAERLAREYGARPQGVPEVCVLVPPRQLAERRLAWAGQVQVEALSLRFAQLSLLDIATLLGAIGDESPGMQALGLLLGRQAAPASVAQLQRELRTCRHLSGQERRVVQLRLAALERFLGCGAAFGEQLRPGRLVIIDLRDPLLSPAMAFRLLIVLLRHIGQIQDQDGAPIPKTLIFNEFHRYGGHPQLLRALETAVRLMRHENTAILIDAQTPGSIPETIIALSSLIICTRLVSPLDLRHLAARNHAFAHLAVDQLRTLAPGQGWCWAQECAEPAPTRRPIRIDLRPPVSRIGGRTRTAVSAVRS